MSNKVIQKFQKERSEVTAQAEAIMERDDFDPKDETYVALKQRASDLTETIKSLSDFSAQKAAADALDVSLAQSHQGAPHVRSSVNQELTTPGEFFVRSGEWQQHAAGGFLGRSRPVSVPGLLRTRAPHLTTDFDLPTTTRDRDLPPVTTPVLDSITVVPVTTGSVDVVTWDFQDAAAVVPEGTAKPEATLVQDVASITLDTIAHYVDVSRQLLSDSAAVARKVDEGLRRGVLRKMEAEAATVVLGGTYPSITNADPLAGVREAIADLQEAGMAPDTLYLAPAQWAALDVGVQAGRTDGATGVLQTTYWGLRVVPLTGATGPMVADGREAFEAYRREAVQVFTTDSDGSKFLSNIVTILGEARQSTLVVNPAAVRTVDAA